MRVLIFVFSILLGCSSVPNFPSAPADCPSACERMAVLGCDGAQGSPGPDQAYSTADDVSCEAVCLEFESIPGATLNPGCIANAQTCAAVEACAEE